MQVSMNARLLQLSSMAMNALCRALSRWQYVGSPQGFKNITRIRLDPMDSRIWYVASDGDGLFVTRDAGKHWERHLSGNVGALELATQGSAVAYASVGTDVYCSSDHGVTWSLVHSFHGSDPGGFIDSLLVNASSIYVGMSNAVENARLYVSHDSGKTWTASFQRRGLHIWGIAEDPVNRYLYFCTEHASLHDNTPVMRSMDLGATWEDVSQADRVHSLNVAVHPTEHEVFVLTESSYLETSKDFGASWSSKEVGFGSVLVIDRNSPSWVFGGEMVRGVKRGGVYVSSDGGDTFGPPTLLDKTITSLTLNGGGTHLFAIAYGDGIYRLALCR